MLGVRLRLGLASSLLVAVVAVVADARAQPNEEPHPTPKAGSPAKDGEQARALYVSGTEAARGGQWADALKDFRASYALEKNPAALFNIGVALRGLGRYKQARDTFDELLTTHRDELDDATRDKAQSLRDQAARRVATLRIHTFSDCEVNVDNAVASPAGQVERSLELDPGDHALSIVCPKRQPMTREVTLQEGATATLHLEPDAIVAPKPIVVTREAPAASPVPWVLVGVGSTVAVAGAVLFGVGFSERSHVEGAEDGTAWNDVKDAYGRARLFSWLGPLFMGVGVAATAAGVVWWRVDGNSRAQTGLVLGPGAVSVRGQF